MFSWRRVGSCACKAAEVEIIIFDNFFFQATRISVDRYIISNEYSTYMRNDQRKFR